MATEPTLVRVDRTPEAAAVQVLYERYARRVYGFCLNQLGTREEAEDATQSTFLNAFRALRRGVTPVAESAWLLSIAQNVCFTRMRSSVRRRRVEAPRDLQALQDEVPAPPRDGFDELLRLEDALTELPATQRRAILLREWQGLSYREIAAELETSQAAVETLIFRARQALAARLEEAPRRSLARRVARWVDIGSAAGWLQALLAGGTAKAVATAAAVATVAVAGSAPLRHDAPPPADAAPKRSPPAARSVAPAPQRATVAVRAAAPVVRATTRSRPATTRSRPVAGKATPVRRTLPPQRPVVVPVAEPEVAPPAEAEPQPAAARNADRAGQANARGREREKSQLADPRNEHAVKESKPPPPGRPTGPDVAKEAKEKEHEAPAPRGPS